MDAGPLGLIARLLLVHLLNDGWLKQPESSKAQETCHEHGYDADPSWNVPAVDRHVPLQDEPKDVRKGD
jgi:hypothetical protein